MSLVMANPPPSSQSSPFFPAVETNTLPQDVLLEILLRLPVKSLVRFRAVHTSWQSLSQNPNFISAHFRRSNLLSPRKVLLNTYLPESAEQAAFFLSGETLEAVDISEISNLVGEGMYLLGSCNGVFCVTDRERNKFLLWNPATRETMLLPPPLILATEQYLGRTPYCGAVGFGLDPVGGDLKVVRFMFCVEVILHYARADVYSLKSHSWREIQVDLEHLCVDVYDLDCDGNHAYSNGNYHWLNRSCRMFSFDMTREVFKSSKVPTSRWNICNGFSGSLSAIAAKNPSMELWSMVGSNNWKLVKKFESYLNEFLFMMPPVLRDDDDEVLLVTAHIDDEDYYDWTYEGYTGELWIFNITKQEARKFPNLGKGKVRQLFPYVESLASISSNYQA